MPVPHIHYLCCYLLSSLSSSLGRMAVLLKLDVVSCYRQSSVVCLSVCHDHQPCTKGWTHQYVIRHVHSGGPKEPRIRWGVHTGTTWRIRLNRPWAAPMRHFCQITLTTCYACRHNPNVPHFWSRRQTCLEHGVDSRSAVGGARQEQVAMIRRILDAMHGAVMWLKRQVDGAL